MIQAAEAERSLDRRAPRWPVLVLASCACVLAAAELAAAGFARVSRIERRTAAEMRAALGVRPGAASGRSASILIAGNSLLDKGVNFPALARALGANVDARRLVVEQTAYLDWYYGLRRLFRAGSRPDVAVLKLNAAQLLSGAIRGDYTASRLMSAGDIWRAARDAGFSPTQAFSLWFAHYSLFYGTREEMRKWLLWEVMPGIEELHTHLATFSAPVLTAAEVEAKGAPRLQALRSLADNYGVRFLLLAPAVPSGDATEALIRAGRLAHVEVLAPSTDCDISPTDFSDGLHMNEAGAAKYTTSLAFQLRSALLRQPRLARVPAISGGR